MPLSNGRANRRKLETPLEGVDDKLIPMDEQINISLYLQIISILMAVIAVALPTLIAVVGFIYLRSISERIDNISDQVDQLWDRVRDNKQ